MLWREVKAPWGRGGKGVMFLREMQAPWEKGWNVLVLVVVGGWCGVGRGEAFIFARQARINTANPDKQPS